MLRCWRINANAQNSCANALNLTNTDSCYNNLSTLGTEYWTSFTATNSSMQVAFTNLGADTAEYFRKIIVCSGTCSTLVAVDSSFVTLPDSVINLTVSNLTIGNTYYFKAYGIANPSPSSVLKPFDICLASQSCLLIIGCPPDGCPGCLTFTNNSFGPNGNLDTSCFKNYFWTFPGGVPASYIGAQPPCITYFAPGNYIATLYEADINGNPINNNSVQCAIVIFPNPSGFLTSPAPVCVGVPVCIQSQALNAFNPNTVGGPTIILDFGDGWTVCNYIGGCSSATYSGNDCHAYAQPGTYNITLTIYGCDTLVFATTIKISGPVAEFSYADVCLGSATQFNDMSTCLTFTPISYSWNFGDNTTSNQQNPSHTYAAAGTYTVTLVVTDVNGNSSSVQHTVQVFPLPTAPSFTGPLVACDPNAGNYVYTVNPINPNYIYDWTANTPNGIVTGTGTTASGFNMSTAGGAVTFCVTDTNGCKACSTLVVFPCCDTLDPGGSPCIFPPGNYLQIGINTPYTTASSLFALFNTSNITLAKFLLNGTLTIDINITFTKCHFYMGPYSKINVLAGRTLVLDDDRFEAGCCIMWDGIYLTNNTSTVEANTSYFEDAFNTIVSNNGGVYKIRTCGFNKNLRSIVVNPFNGVHSGVVQNTEFTCASNVYNTLTLNPILSPGNFLLPPYAGKRSDVAIDIINVQQIKIGNEAFAQFKNRFNNHNIGIRSNGSNTNVQNALFTNINTQLNQNVRAAIYSYTNNILNVGSLKVADFNIPVQRTCEFVNCYTGIEMGGLHNTSSIINNKFNGISNIGIFIYGVNNTAATVTAQFNNMLLCRIAIEGFMNGGGKFLFNQNTINGVSSFIAPPQGIVMVEFSSINTGVFYMANTNTISNVQYGIRASNLYAANIINNTITTRSFNTTLSRGIEVLANQSTTVSLNTINHQNNTIQISRGGIYSSISPQTYFYCNDISKLGYAMKCEGSMPSDIFNNTFQNCFRGFWLSNNGFVGVQDNPNISGQASYNKWIAFGSNDRTYTSGITDGSQSPFYYRTPNPNNLPQPAVAQMLQDISIGVVSVSSGPQNINCNPPPPNFLLKAAHLIAQNQINFPANDANAKWISRQDLFYNIKAKNISTANDTVLQNFMNTSNNAPLGQLALLSQTISNSSTTNAALLSAQLQNNFVLCNNAIETNLQAVNNLFINYRLNGTLTANEISNLQSIAALCPFTDGIGVYGARALLTVFDSITYENACEQDAGNERIINTETEQTETIKTIKVYPNPTTGELNFECELTTEQIAQIIIYDMMGKQLKNVNTNTTGITNIDLSLLDAGVYFYCILINGELKQTDRIVLIK